jgi:RNA polymerase sigma factor (sigma-70 family)
MRALSLSNVRALSLSNGPALSLSNGPTLSLSNGPAVSLSKVRALSLSNWFMEEVHPHDSSLKAYLRGSFPAVRDVEDVVQESYVRVWKARAAQPIRHAKGFLFQVARRLALDILRRGRASPIDLGRDLAYLSVITHDPTAAEAATLMERKRLLIDAVVALPARYREIVILRKLEDVPQKEVAARLGISERTVENLLGRGVRRCEDYLRRRGMSSFSES